MGLNETPRGERLHIALFGKRNAGKSSIINALTNQNLAIVSDQKGTTTDPVYKAMEILPLGPVVLIDTPGIDDEGELGKLRVSKAKEVMAKADAALVIVDSTVGFSGFEKDLLVELKERKIPAMVLLNKSDLLGDAKEIDSESETKKAIGSGGETRKEIDFQREEIKAIYDVPVLAVSAAKKEGIEQVKELLGRLEPEKEEEKRVVGDLIGASDFLVLVVPIDAAAPKGRLILPQQQTIRDILEEHGVSIVVQDTELKETLAVLGKKPKLVITDSQAFAKVAKDTPDDILLTSFSILFARYKGELADLVRGAKTVDSLKDGDVILMAEGCTHHRQCGDIGTVKLPGWILEHTGKNLIFETASGTGFPEDLSRYAMVVHCGACTLNPKEMKHRIRRAKEQNVPIVNYGILIAYLKGILKRSLELFPNMIALLEERDNMEVTYISHSGFLVETENAYLLFDYYKGEIPAMKGEKPLYVFSSHFHHDHYNKEVFQLEDGSRKVTYIFSDDIRKRKKRTICSHNVIFMKENEKKQVDGLEIETLLSTDEGVAFLVHVDGKTIYHAGDLHWWHWIGDPDEENKERERSYKNEIRKLEGRQIDVAFLVLDPRQEDAFDWGFDYFLKEIKPDVAFPMHFWEDYSVIPAYCNSEKAQEVREKVMEIVEEGQVFSL